jgi:hypothetical protein
MANGALANGVLVGNGSCLSAIMPSLYLNRRGDENIGEKVYNAGISSSA